MTKDELGILIREAAKRGAAAEREHCAGLVLDMKIEPGETLAEITWNAAIVEAVVRIRGSHGDG